MMASHHNVNQLPIMTTGDRTSSLHGHGQAIPVVPPPHRPGSAHSFTTATMPALPAKAVALPDDGTEQILTACEPCSSSRMRLANLRGAKKYVDLRLVLPDNRTDIAAHKVVVASASDVLANALDTLGASGKSSAADALPLGHWIPPVPMPVPLAPGANDGLGADPSPVDPVAATNAIALGLIDWCYTKKLAIRGAVPAVATSRAARDLGLSDLVPVVDALVCRYMEADPVKILRAAVQYRADDIVNTAVRVLVQNRLLADPNVRRALTCLPLARFKSMIVGPPRTVPGSEVPIGGELAGLLPVDRFNLVVAYVDRPTSALPCLLHTPRGESVRPGAFPSTSGAGALGEPVTNKYCTCDHARPIDAAALFSDTVDFAQLDVATLRAASAMPNVPTNMIMNAMFAKLEGLSGTGGGASGPQPGAYGQPAAYQSPMPTGGYAMPMPVPVHSTGQPPHPPQQQQAYGLPPRPTGPPAPAKR